MRQVPGKHIMIGEETKFLFSVVMPVYNTGAYLYEAIESLLHQTIGFKTIQLILVDDGSTDSSGKICEEYAQKYADNITVIHKENHGVSSARNAGLPYVKGQYISFIDSDDRIAVDAFEKAYVFFQKHSLETDAAIIPLKYFDASDAGHPLNAIFEQDTDILDLNQLKCNVNLSVASFISAASVNTASGDGLRFDEQLACYEVPKFLLTLLLDKGKIGLIHDTTYWQRIRNSGEAAKDRLFENTKDWYSNTLRHYHLDIINLSMERLGFVPKFVQYEVMYDLKKRWRQSHIPLEVLSSKERKNYTEMLVSVTKRIDDDVITNQTWIDDKYKIYILHQKYGIYPQIRTHSGKEHFLDEHGNELESGIFDVSYGEPAMFSKAGIKSCFDFLSFEDAGSTVIIEGYHDIGTMRTNEMRPAIMINNVVHYCETMDRTVNCGRILDQIYEDKVGFRLRFTLPDGQCSIVPALVIDGFLYPVSTLIFGYHFPVSDVYRYAYARSESHVITTDGNSVCIEEKPGHFWTFKRELSFLHEIWRKHYQGGRKAVVGRIGYHLLRPFKRKKLWLVSDRVNKADDNGEAIFRYIQKTKPDGVKAVFALSKKSDDYGRLRKTGKCIDSMSLYHKLLYLLSDVTISSHTYEMFSGYSDAVRDLLWTKKIVFIPHGITKEDISNYLNRYRQNFAGFITASSMEKDSILNGSYGYCESQVWLTGHARYDYLYHDEKKVITLMPTWRRYLFKSYQDKTGLWDIKDNFEQTEYFIFYNSLLNSERLLSALAEYGYTLKFMPHPNMQQYSNRFTHHKDVVFLPIDTIYRDVLAESQMIITDFSAAIFDFVYLKKPIIYCQFDKEEYYSKHLAPGYFSYENNGFGEVVYNLDDTIDTVIEYVKNGCSLKDKYNRRIDDFFAYIDQDNCKRILEKITML